MLIPMMFFFRLTLIYSLALLAGTFITLLSLFCMIDLPSFAFSFFILFFPFTITLLSVCVCSWSRTELISTGMPVLFLALAS